MTCYPHFVSFAENLIPVSRHRDCLLQPLFGAIHPAIANPAANAVTGRSLAARTELGAPLRAGGRTRAKDIMMTGRRALLAALTCAAIVITAFGALADGSTGATSPEEIGRQLKSRGLPFGALPMGTASPQPSSGVSPDAQAVPLIPGAPKSRGVPSTAEPPQPTPASRPSLTLNAITFEIGSATLTPESLDQLRNLGIALNQIVKDGAKFVIEGHTDKKGTAAYNLELSKRRAEAVKDYLVNEMGVQADRLETVGRGFSKPANPGNPNAPENRRVVVVNLGAS